MKKVLIEILIVAAVLSSCKKEDQSVFDKSPDDRINEKLAAYQAQLSGAQNGWKGFIKPDSGKGPGYSFYFKFNTTNRVVMLSDFDSSSAAAPKESSYRLKALQQPSLIFDTYSYLHVLSDPDETVNGGSRGGGLLSDFEFYFDSTTADTLKLVGRFNGSKLVLVSASKAEADAYNSGALAAGTLINKILTYFKRLTIGTQLYDIRIYPVTRQVIFDWVDGAGAAHTFTTNYFFTIAGISLTNPLQTGTQTIKEFTAITFSASSQIISLKVNNQSATITQIVVPLNVDVNAPRRWYNQPVYPREDWISEKGFHVNGVDDAYNVNSLTSGSFPYSYYIYEPKFGPNYDFFGPIFYDGASQSYTIEYGTAPVITSFTPDGRAVFLYLGDLGAHPASGPAAQTRAALYTAKGFYFVQTGDNSYDMVSATDGKSWITWVR
ncbi:MAG: DUF4302 domain-containing protein [Ginsengibacter sp.]